MAATQKTITLRAILTGAFFAAFFALVAILGINSPSPVYISSTQIAPLCYMLLLALVLLLNPFLRLIRIIRPFSVAETMTVFVMCAVSAGIPIYGLAMQLIPITGSFFYKDWNTEQAEWNRYVEPYVNEYYFISEPGIQDCAKEYSAAVERLDALNRTRSLAGALIARKDDLKAAEALQEPARTAARARAEQFLEDTQKRWNEHKASEPGLPEADEVQRTYPALLVEQEKLTRASKAKLTVLTDKAAEKVKLFRSGLPPTKQAYPGIIPLAGDDAQSYWGRLRRLSVGSSALGSLHELDTKLAAAPADAPPSADLLHAGAPLLQDAVAHLEPLADTHEILASQKALSQELERLRTGMEGFDEELAKLNEKKRTASADEQDELNGKISALTRQRADALAERDSTTLRRQSKDTQIEMAKRIQSVLADLGQLRDKMQAGSASCTLARSELAAITERFPSFDVSYRRYFFGDTPWEQWWPVLWRWGLLALFTYVLLITFNVLIFRQWAHNEKLIYPLAELPLILGGKNDASPGRVPEIFTSGLFWLGLLLSGGILMWNFLAKSQLVAGITPLDLDSNWDPYIRNTWLKALLPRTRSQVFFTMIGLAFFTPAKTSFSLWFFRVIYMIQILILVGLGFGENEESFKSEWWYILNFATAQGMGAMMVFASLALYTCRRYLLCAFFPAAVSNLEADERRELRWSSLLYLTALLGLILMLWQGMGANFWFTLLAVAGIMLLTIGLMRAVAEGGILGFQADCGPFHLIRTLFGFDKGFSSPALFMPIMIYFSIFFLDIKSFIAPMIANSMKIREETRMERSRYHVSIGIAIVLAIAVSIGVSLMMSYARGANSLEGWFYTGLPQSFFPLLKDITQSPPHADYPQAIWLLVGGLSMAALLYFRQYWFWLPHPIGMIMLVNPLMRFYWFSILLGWLAKSLVTRYGSRETYTRVRAFFIGLIVGELMVVTVSLVLSYWWNLPNAAIDLDRASGKTIQMTHKRSAPV